MIDKLEAQLQRQPLRTPSAQLDRRIAALLECDGPAPAPC